MLCAVPCPGNDGTSRENLWVGRMTHPAKLGHRARNWVGLMTHPTTTSAETADAKGDPAERGRSSSIVSIWPIIRCRDVAIANCFTALTLNPTISHMN